MTPAVVLVTDPAFSFERTEFVVTEAAAAIGGALLVQLRDKTAALVSLRETASKLRALTRRLDVRFVVNASTRAVVELARQIDADGVHVPCSEEAIGAARSIVGRSGRGAWLSVPAHSDDDVRLAARAGVDAVLVSPVFDSPGKGPPRGTEALVTARKLATEHVAVFALGGVTGENIGACAKAGADGVAVIRALLAAEDVAATARRLHAPWKR